MLHKSGWKFPFLAAALLSLASCSQSTTGDIATPATPDPLAESADNVRLVGYNDLQGRTALMVQAKSDPANGDWVYVGHHESFRDGQPLMNPITGQMEYNGTSILDIADPAHPKLVWEIDMNPPFRGPHTVNPIVYTSVPNIGPSALPRTYAFIVDEAAGVNDSAPCPNGIRAASYMVDITTENRPMVVSTWQVPVGNFCQKGGRFGPHQSADAVNGKLNRFEDKIAWIAYFNAGVRVVDLSNPFQLQELGYYLPKTNQNSYSMGDGQPVAIQMNDVDIDHRGLAYASDRVGTGLFVLEYTGPKPGAAPR